MKTKNMSDFISAWTTNYSDCEDRPANQRFVNIDTETAQFASLKASVAKLIENLGIPKTILKDGAYYCLSYDIGSDKVLSFNFTFETTVLMKEYRGLVYETCEPRSIEIFNIVIDDNESGLRVAFEDVTFEEVAISSKIFDSIARGVECYNSRAGSNVAKDFESWVGISHSSHSTHDGVTK